MLPEDVSEVLLLHLHPPHGYFFDEDCAQDKGNHCLSVIRRSCHQFFVRNFVAKVCDSSCRSGFNPAWVETMLGKKKRDRFIDF